MEKLGLICFQLLDDNLSTLEGMKGDMQLNQKFKQ